MAWSFRGLHAHMTQRVRHMAPAVALQVLPLDDMCRGIEGALREMERHHNSVAPQVSAWQVRRAAGHGTA